MEDQLFNDAVFRLGQLGADRALTNHKLLRRVSRILARYTGVEVAGVAVHNDGMKHPATQTYVVGPWSDEQSSQFLDWSSWTESDSDTATKLSSFKRNTIHTLDELFAEDDGYQKSRLYNEFHRPLSIIDQAYGIFRRPDGCELFIAINALEADGPLSEKALTRFTKISPFIAKAWAAGWRREPGWVKGLKPHCRAVLELVLEGFDDDQIADKTGLTYHAVRAHLKRLFRAANVRSRLHLMQAYKEERAGRPDNSPRADQPNDVVTVVDPMDTAFGLNFSAAS